MRFISQEYHKAFVAYARTRMGVSTVTYEFIERMLVRMNLFVAPELCEYTARKAYIQMYGRNMLKELDFQKFVEFYEGPIAMLYAHATDTTLESAIRKLRQTLISTKPTSAMIKI